MGKKPYRVEVNYPKSGKPKYYLVKDVKVNGKKRKARKYLGVVPPTAEDVDFYRKKYAYVMESKAAKKKAEIGSSFYESRYLTKAQIITVEEIKYIYETFTDLLTTNEIERYEESFEVCYVQGTTSIEGNTLTLDQTYDLLMKNVPPNDKSLREINEVQNFRNVKRYRDKRHGKVDLDFIKDMHAMIMNNIDLETPGVFRRIDNITISGCDLRVTPAELIEEELLDVIDIYYESLNRGFYPFEEAVMFHYNFEMIHPFTDGNGRVGREIFNYMLSKLGYPKLLFLGNDRKRYIESLRFGNAEEYGQMIQIFANLISDQRLAIIKENLKKVVVPPKRTGQVRLTDFYQTSKKNSA
jgi:fido (protein-threonine AMPylation protein)